MTRKEAIQILSTRDAHGVLCGYTSGVTEALDMAIEALSAPPTDLISRADALESMAQAECGLHYNDCEADGCSCSYIRRILDIPSARPKGEWEDKDIFDDMNDDHIVEEWQSARCSNCGKYHTTPYMYYFDDFDFCPNCGAEMGTVVIPKPYKGGDSE